VIFGVDRVPQKLLDASYALCHGIGV